MFETCHTPNEVKFWIDEIEKTTIDRGPIDELLEVIYVLQKEDTEPPKISAIRSELKAFESSCDNFRVKYERFTE